MRVLIAPDKFKGSLTAREAADAIAKGFSHLSGLTLDLCPIADGGEGFVEALNARREPVANISDPLGRPITASCGWLNDTTAATAVVETSDASGLHRLTPAERNPWQATTCGTGQLISHAISHGAKRILVGLGGSATNDAGVGLAAALGWNFLTSDGEPMDPRPSNFLAIERIEAPETDFPAQIVAACDVRNPLLGPHGASRTYARQKGATDQMIEHLELALDHLADLVADQLGIDHRNLPGAGAAGGLGYGLVTFCNATLTRGFDLVAETLHLESRIAAADLIITGEGAFDSQSLHGKAPAEVARLARKHNKPVALACGHHVPTPESTTLFDLIIPLDSLEPNPDLCLTNASPLLAKAATRIADWAISKTENRYG